MCRSWDALDFCHLTGLLIRVADSIGKPYALKPEKTDDFTGLPQRMSCICEISSRSKTGKDARTRKSTCSCCNQAEGGAYRSFTAGEENTNQDQCLLSTDKKRSFQHSDLDVQEYRRCRDHDGSHPGFRPILGSSISPNRNRRIILVGLLGSTLSAPFSFQP